MTGQILGTATALAGLVALTISSMSAGQVPPALRPLPIVIKAVEPAYPTIAKQAQISGSVDLEVFTDGERVTKVAILEPRPLLDLVAQRDVATWVFAPHEPTSFRMTVEYQIHARDPVTPESWVRREESEVVTYALPRHVRVIGHPDFIYDGPPMMKKELTASVLEGQVICDCLGRMPVRGVTVEYNRIPTAAEYKRDRVTKFEGRIDVDADGRFRVEGAPAGRYSLTIWNPDYDDRGWFVNLVPGGRTRPSLSLPIVPNPLVGEYLRTHPRKRDWVGRSNQIPTYPLEALKNGVSGTVIIRVAPEKAPVIIDGPAALASAALEIAKTWTIASRNGESFDVKMEYRLAKNGRK